jgi:hypothetical protein
MRNFSMLLGYAAIGAGVAFPVIHAFQQHSLTDGVSDFVASWSRVALTLYALSFLSHGWGLLWGRLTRKSVAMALERAKKHYAATGARLVYVTTQSSPRFRRFELHDAAGRALRRDLYWEQIMAECKTTSPSRRSSHV